jgi:hypothetical protein
MSKEFVPCPHILQNKLQEYCTIDKAVGSVTWRFSTVDIRGRQRTIPRLFCLPLQSHLEFILCSDGNADPVRNGV